jgi:hypothetical protein
MASPFLLRKSGSNKRPISIFTLPFEDLSKGKSSTSPFVRVYPNSKRESGGMRQVIMDGWAEGSSEDFSRQGTRFGEWQAYFTAIISQTLIFSSLREKEYLKSKKKRRKEIFVLG